MKFQNSKLAAIILAALMLASIGAALFATAAADTTPTPTIRKTYAYISAQPDVIGVGQKMYVYMWVNQIFPNANMTNDYRFHNFKLTITKPDNTTETKTFEYIADSTSNYAYAYTPATAGTYTALFEFPQTNVNATSHRIYNSTNNGPELTQNDVFLASNATCTFTVQEEAISTFPDSYPLPTEYWTRPIYGENPFWYSVSSNWLGMGAPGYRWLSVTGMGASMGGNAQMYPADAVGSLTGHVMWTKALQSGGVVGGDLFDIYGNTWFDGSAYDVRYVNPIIVSGKLFYTEPLSYTAGTGGDTVAVDLRTGKELWRSSTLGWSGTLSFALVADFENGNQHGVYNALLVAVSGTTWRMYDADTGKALWNATGIPTSGMKAAGPYNEFIYYTTTRNNSGIYLNQWNSSKLFSQGTTGTTANTGLSIDASTTARYDWMNVPITYKGNNYGNGTIMVLAAKYGDYMLCMNGTYPSTGTNSFFGTTEIYKPYTYFLVNLNESKGTIGDISWMNTVTQDNNATIVYSGIDETNRVFIEGNRESLYWIGYNLNTGAEMWSTEEYPQADMDYYGSQASGSLTNALYDGKLYSSAYAGIVYCYDSKTGDLLWTYGNGGAGNSTQSGLEVPGNYPTFISGFGQGVVYTLTSEHTIQTPIYKGALARCLNATTGAEIWTVSDYTNEFSANAFAIADGYNTWFNGYDNSVYVVGKGPSTTTVTAPNAGLVFGQSVVIRGTVMDVSSGATQSEQAARFVNGLPVASDASMTEWMGYVYQDKPAPSNFTGVPVTISVVDANGNYRTVGTTTTDITGMYSLSWTPDIAGDYTVIATFAGTNGYWASTSRTTFAVDQPVATATPMPTPAPSAADLYFLPAIAALLVAVIIAIAMIALVLMKKP